VGRLALKVYFSSSSRVWEDIRWIYGIEEAGYAGWEIVADGNYRLDDPRRLAAIKETVGSTTLGITVHAPYADLNCASMNHAIWEESIRQIIRCIEAAAELTDRVTIHPGYISPVGRMMPDKVWEMQKKALVRIGKAAMDCGVLACLENMISMREILCRDPGELLGMVDGVEGVGTTIDLGHAHTTGTLNRFLEVIDRADHLHIHDNHGVHDEHLPLGGGLIDWERVGSAVTSAYTGEIAVVEGRGLDEGLESLKVFRRCFL